MPTSVKAKVSAGDVAFLRRLANNIPVVFFGAYNKKAGYYKNKDMDKGKDERVIVT